MVAWQRVAELARELPEIEETTSWGKPSAGSPRNPEGKRPAAQVD